jgi:hypothetical protein
VIYASNGGRGTLRARVVSDDGVTLEMERWDTRRKGRYHRRFQLTRHFLESPACGWRKEGE